MRTQSQASQGDSQTSTDTRTARQAQTTRQTRRGLGRVRQTRHAVSQSSSSASHPKPYHSVNPWPRAVALDSTDQTQYSQASASAYLQGDTGVQYGVTGACGPSTDTRTPAQAAQPKPNEPNTITQPATDPPPPELSLTTQSVTNHQSDPPDRVDRGLLRRSSTNRYRPPYFRGVR